MRETSEDKQVSCGEGIGSTVLDTLVVKCLFDSKPRCQVSDGMDEPGAQGRVRTGSLMECPADSEERRSQRQEGGTPGPSGAEAAEKPAQGPRGRGSEAGREPGARAHLQSSGGGVPEPRERRDGRAWRPSGKGTRGEALLATGARWPPGHPHFSGRGGQGLRGAGRGKTARGEANTFRLDGSVGSLSVEGAEDGQKLKGTAGGAGSC